MTDDIEVIDLLSDSSSSCRAAAATAKQKPQLQRQQNDDDIIDVDAEYLSIASSSSSSSSSGIPGESPTHRYHRPPSVTQTTSALENDHDNFYGNDISVREADDKDNTLNAPSNASNNAKSADSIISISSSSVANDEVLTKRDLPMISSSERLSRKRPNHLIGSTINTSNNPKRKIRRRKIRRTDTRYDKVKKAPKSHVYYGRKRPPELLWLIHTGRLRALSSNEISNDSEFIGDWWDINSHFSQGENKYSKASSLEQQLCTVVPETVMVTSDNEQTVTSGVTIEPALSNSDVEILSIASSSVECHTCERHSLLLGQIEQLVERAKTISEDDNESFNIDFISKIEALLNDIEANAYSGISIFYHECSGSEQFNTSLTIVKLLQVFDGLCKICTMAAISDDAIQRLFRFKKSGQCGVILRILYVTTYELIVSRGNVRHDTDHVMAVTYGLHMIATMMKNIYSDSRAKLQGIMQFLKRPLECHKRCIKRNCRVGNRGVTACQSCGLRFHKSCFAHEVDEVDVFDKRCPACKVSVSLLKACKEGNFADIYSLVVEKGASPFQAFTETGCSFETEEAITETGSSFETALHAAVCCNDYDMMSMLLFGGYLLLNCDESLRDWNVPSLAWGIDSRKLTPFEKAIDVCITDLNAKAPTEILFLLRNRGDGGKIEDIQDALKKRHQMIRILKDMSESEVVQSDVSMGVESVAVKVCESALLKTNFFYVSRSIESRETAIRWFDCRVGKNKRLSSFQGNCTEDKLKKLHRDQSLPPSWRAYCNYLCSSKGQCSCQLEMRFNLEIFETNGRGFGLRTAKGVSIKKGDIICNYVGEIVSASEAKKRDEEHAKAGEIGSYIINLDEKGDFCIDATLMRSASAFINHSCAESNTSLFRALRHHLDEKFPYLVFRAKQDIGELQELTFNYVKGMPDGEKPTALCSQCKREHCLCPQCTEIEHRKHGAMV